MAWTCEKCSRQFGRNKQSHECAPAMTLDEYFSTGPSHERSVCEAVLAHVLSLGDVHIEPVSVGIFLKNPRTFAQLRPKEKWVALSFSLSRRAAHRTVVRKVMPYSGRYYHVANVATPADFDDTLAELLTEAYESARDGL